VTFIGMIIQIELTASEADLVVRWLEEKKPLTSHYVGTLAENVILKISTAKREAEAMA
jgi:hypothetical protein